MKALAMLFFVSSVSSAYGQTGTCVDNFSQNTIWENAATEEEVNLTKIKNFIASKTPILVMCFEEKIVVRYLSIFKDGTEVDVSETFLFVRNGWFGI